MDTGDKIFCSVMGIIILVCVWLFSSMIYTGLYLDPIREDIAQRACVESGHETFITYTTTLYSKYVRALYCGTYEERMIKEGNIDAYQNTGDEKGTFVVKSGAYI